MIMELWKDRLKGRIKGLAEMSKNPREALERTMADQYGTIPGFRNPENIVDSAEFQGILQERHGLTAASFPMTVTPQPHLEEDVPDDLEAWIHQLVRPISN